MSLSEVQQKGFNACNARLGFKAGEVSKLPTNNKKIVFSKDPKQSSVPPKMITVSNIDELMSLLDLPDHGSDEHINYPQALSIKAADKLTSNNEHQLRNMLNCCVAGDARKVSDNDKALIHNSLFPMNIAAFAVDSYTVKSGEVLEIKDGTVTNIGTLTVEQGGQIKCDGTANLNCQNLIQNGTQTGSNYTINLSLPEISPAQAGPGDPGTKPTTPGEPGNPGANCNSHCKSAPTNGGKGHNGGPGGNGDNGTHGANGPILHCQVSSATGSIRIYAGAQEGQIGGNGGKGGDGGAGGAAGTSASNCPKAANGSQGDGGRGGDGGTGGNGGAGAQVYFHYSGSASIDPVFGTTNGAKGGNPGAPGAGPTNAGSGGHGDSGKPGAPPVIQALSM